MKALAFFDRRIPEQYLEEAQSFLDKGPFTENEKERLSVLRDSALVLLLEKLRAEGGHQSDLLETILMKGSFFPGGPSSPSEASEVSNDPH